MIELSVHRKAFQGAAPVLKDLQLRLAEGEITALLGPSGVGKSTLLNILAGVDSHFDGRWHGGRQHRVGMMFQGSRLMPWMTVLENLCLVGAHPDDASTRRRAQRLLERVGLGEHGEAFPGMLSGGMQRRVALARALMPEPELLLLDEPLVSLDEVAAASLRQLLLELWQEKKYTIVYVTHQLDDAVEVADRVLFLSWAPAQVLREDIIALPRPRSAEDIGLWSRRLRRAWLEEHG